MALIEELEWCEHGGGFTALYRDGEQTQVWVHECGKPSYEVWKKHERFCNECGRSFSSPFESMCRECADRWPEYRGFTGAWLTWSVAWSQSLACHPGYVDHDKPLALTLDL